MVEELPITEYRGNPVLNLPMAGEKQRPFAFGLSKAKALLSYVGAVEAFVAHPNPLTAGEIEGCQVTDYKGSPVLNLPLSEGGEYAFSFGMDKARAVTANWDMILKFVRQQELDPILALVRKAEADIKAAQQARADGPA
ncbi:MAG: hypothetical protein JXB47_09955 [Anaerolineae bacterium]|nr:hypothetical protein [Anaerolineae bacterium]